MKNVWIVIGILGVVIAIVIAVVTINKRKGQVSQAQAEADLLAAQTALRLLRVFDNSGCYRQCGHRYPDYFQRRPDGCGTIALARGDVGTGSRGESKCSSAPLESWQHLGVGRGAHWNSTIRADYRTCCHRHCMHRPRWT